VRLLACAAALLLVATPVAGARTPRQADLTLRVTHAAGGPLTLHIRCPGPRGICRPTRLGALRALIAQASRRDRICTQIYGGPEVAALDGRLGGRRVSLRIARDDGCGIADYTHLFDLLGRREPRASG